MEGNTLKVDINRIKVNIKVVKEGIIRNEVTVMVGTILAINNRRVVVIKIILKVDTTHIKEGTTQVEVIQEARVQAGSSLLAFTQINLEGTSHVMAILKEDIVQVVAILKVGIIHVMVTLKEDIVQVVAILKEEIAQVMVTLKEEIAQVMAGLMVGTAHALQVTAEVAFVSYAFIKALVAIMVTQIIITVQVKPEAPNA
jgi:hypothetical protein